MMDIICPKCKGELQFPFMICPDCRWKAKGQTVIKHSHLAEMYISEHPDDRDQLRYVLDMVMKDKVEEAEEAAQGSKRSAEMGKKIKVWYILVSGFLGTLWIWFGLFVWFVGTEDNPIPITSGCCIANFISMALLLASVVLLILKLISLKDR